MMITSRKFMLLHGLGLRAQSKYQSPVQKERAGPRKAPANRVKGCLPACSRLYGAQRVLRNSQEERVQVTATEFPGLLLLEPRVFQDGRGFFMETWSRRTFEAAGLNLDFAQDNHAHSLPAGVLRGFHFQRPPQAQAKLVWVTRGAVLDAALDLRRGSPTYGRVFARELTA